MDQPASGKPHDRQLQVRISAATHANVAELANAQGVSMAEILERAVEAYRRQWFFDQAEAAYARLRADPAAWNKWQSELAAWDATLLDGLEDAPARELVWYKAMVAGYASERKGRGWRSSHVRRKLRRRTTS